MKKAEDEKTVESFIIESTHTDESMTETMDFIESKRDWDYKTQTYRVDPSETARRARETNLSESKIYWRGLYLIIEHNNVIHYWDSAPYCFLKEAVDLMQLNKPAKWKTIDRLISFRAAIRQTEVNGCGYVDELLRGTDITLSLYKEFMKLARAHDYQHHRSHTF